MALIGFLTLGDSIGQAGMTSILIGLIGVLLLSETPEIRGDWFKRINNYPSKLGVYRDSIWNICYLLSLRVTWDRQRWSLTAHWDYINLRYFCAINQNRMLASLVSIRTNQSCLGRSTRQNVDWADFDDSFALLVHRLYISKRCLRKCTCSN